jgi:hypothetical protein
LIELIAGAEKWAENEIHGVTALAVISMTAMRWALTLLSSGFIQYNA